MKWRRDRAGKSAVRALAREARTEGYVVMPGLVNAHDHLEFNLFPRLGDGIYPNATAWARDIYHPEQSPIREHLAVPKPVRLWWGALKNLLSGVTTVCHHNPYEKEVFQDDAFPIRVVRRIIWSHSLDFDSDVAGKARRAGVSCPLVIHCGEGTDTAARLEFAKLRSLGALNNRTVLVHAVALGAADLEMVRSSGPSIVWCPTSNLRMLGKTLNKHVLESGMSIALGTDSALSADTDLLDELRVARRFLSARRLYQMVTNTPRAILRLHPSVQAQDWIAVRSAKKNPHDAILDGTVAMVVLGGHVRLISPELSVHLPPRLLEDLQPLALEGRPPVLVAANVKDLYKQAAKHLGRDLRLAGKRILT